MFTGARTFAIATVPSIEQPLGVMQSGQFIVFAGTEDDGVFRSTDMGGSWDAVNAGLLDWTILSLAFSPDFAQDGTGFAATASGLYRTRNGGKAWRALALPLEEMAIQCLAVSPSFSHDGLVFAGSEEHGLLRSYDAGTTWEIVETLGHGSVTGIAFSSSGRLIAIASDDGVAVTADGGMTWRRDGANLGPALCLSFTTHESREMLVVGLLDGGIIFSEDDGAEWIPGVAAPTHDDDTSGMRSGYNAKGPARQRPTQ
jgi:photosystem II stability/assembly factor-like uncharacterized protein